MMTGISGNAQSSLRGTARIASMGSRGRYMKP